MFASLGCATGMFGAPPAKGIVGIDGDADDRNPAGCSTNSSCCWNGCGEAPGAGNEGIGGGGPLGGWKDMFLDDSNEVVREDEGEGR